MVKAHIVSAPHSAGIFADMSIDGPVIGTLVLIVDRAKNLPNRKTIGKQDPYCAARLGKEAKKTTTDVRGGQTPRWDQELRFTVHDGPDYYQLELSVFNDDKKTELIGEAWIDLRDIIVPGGGQNDLWQGLTCRGKYAGDIRIEITYYDSRPKPEKPVAKPKPVIAEIESMTAQPKVPKRRPLPSDPFTGQAPVQPSQFVSSHTPTGARPQPTPPREYTSDMSAADSASVPYAPAHSHAHSHSQAGQYGVGRQRHADSYSSASGSAYQGHSPRTEVRRQSLERDRFPVHPDDLDYSPNHQSHVADMRYPPSSPYGSMPADSAYGMEDENGRPPPPPAHRITPGGTPDSMHQHQASAAMRKDVLRNEAHRQSVPLNAYPGRPVYRAYESSPAAVPASNDPYAGASQPATPPRHQSYDAHYESHNRSMQPTVEDVPDSPSLGLDTYKRGVPRASPLAQPDYRNDASPPPLNLSGRNSVSASHFQPSYHQDPTPDYTRTDELSFSTPNYSAGYDNEQELSETQMSAPATIIPTSLIPGVDPALSMEIAQKLNEGGRHERRHNPSIPHLPPAGSTRGRQMLELPPSYSAPPDLSQHAQMPLYNNEAYEHNGSIYSGRASSQHAIVRREMSPSRSPAGRSTIRRKSVSPAPIPESHRLSGIPFGPDSYNALNPALAVGAPKELDSRASREYDEIDGVIITHDGREVDPSDHLPMDTWAPEPEPKTGKNGTASVSFTQPTSGPHSPAPPPSSGRKALRIRERPVSSMPQATYIMPDTASTILPPPGTGRNRLQKKANRSSAMPVMMSGANGSGYGSLAPSPLAPLPQPHERDIYSNGGFPVRASTLDYENHAPAPMYDMSPMPHMNGREHSNSAPPIPAKVPMASSNALVPVRYGDDGGDVALMEEMSRIDIGSGRARRHGHRPAIGGY